MRLPRSDELGEALRHLERCYPREGCGVLIARPDGTFRTRPIANAAGRRARTAYAFDLGEWLHVHRELDAAGERLAFVFHSHCDAEDGFSQEDRALAAPDGAPLLPGVGYLVVAVRSGRAASARWVLWTEGQFQERPFPLLDSHPPRAQG